MRDSNGVNDTGELNEAMPTKEELEIVDAAKTAAGYAGNLYSGLKKVSSKFRNENPQDCVTLFSEATKGLGWLIETIEGLKTLHPDFNSLDTSVIMEYFEEMVESAENMDFVLLADLIEYEIMPIVDDWGSMLDDVLGL